MRAAAARTVASSRANIPYVSAPGYHQTVKSSAPAIGVL